MMPRPSARAVTDVARSDPPPTWPLWLLFVAALMLLWPAPSQAAEADDLEAARREVSRFADAAIAAIDDPELDPGARSLTLKQLFHRHFDGERISRFVLGRHWRRASEAERIAFVSAYADYLIASYAGQVESSGGARLEVQTARLEDRDLVTVKSRIHRDADQPAEVLWRMKRGPGGWRIIDLVLEGVSLAITQRSEMRAYLANQNGGVAGLTEVLKSKTQTIGTAG